VAWLWLAAALAWAVSPAPGPVSPAPGSLGPDPSDVLEPLQRALYEEAVALEARGRYREAAVRYRAVANQVPTWHRARLDQGRALERADRPEAALAAYAELPQDPDAVEASGRLLAAQGEHERAAVAFHRLRDLRPEWPGSRVLEAESQAHLAPHLAALLLEEYLDFDDVRVEDGVIAATRVTAEALRDGGDHRAALELIVDVTAKVGGSPELDALTVALEVDERARALADARDLPLDRDQVTRLQDAREAFAAGRTEEARDQLQALRDEQPLSAVTWATLADVLEEAGDVAGADQAIRAAERLDPMSAAHPAKRGDLLYRWFSGRDAEAAHAYALAAQRRPDDASIWYRKALAEQRSGAWPRALASFQRALELDPADPRAEEARIAIAAAERDRLEPFLFDPHPRPPEVPELAWDAFHRAWAWTERQEDDADARALAELAAARALAPDFVRAIDLEAAIRAERGEVEIAIARYEESLALEPDRGWVVGNLARLHQRAGRAEEATALRERAAQLGDPDALWRRALAQAGARRWSAARRTLAAFFAETAGGPAYEAALALDAELARRIRTARLAAGAGAVGLLAMPVVIRWRRRSGAPLQALIDRAPQSWREVARIGSAIRHEVLKHRTSVLPSVADALEDGDREPARWAAARLFGPDGALNRLDGYLRELEALGRAHGVRLNLAVRDPVFAPLIRHARRLRRLRRALRRGSGLRLVDELRTIGVGLNQDAVRGLGRLVAGLCVLRVDEALLRAVYQAVREEPGFREQEVPPLAIEVATDEALHVRMFRSDLVDVLTNLLRNAVQASIASGGERVGLALGVEDDEVTALDSVVISVCDLAPSKLTTARLRGRYVARGLGLAMDLTNRAGGSIRVATASGWAKALVVRLPRAEVDPA
jgi:tetratricopeptide (TPR) repeat protein